MKGLMLAFEAVLKWSVTAGFVCLAVCLLRLFLQKAPKIFSYGLWAVVFFRFLCPFALPGPVSVVPQWDSVLAVMSAMTAGNMAGSDSGQSGENAGRQPFAYGQTEAGAAGGNPVSAAFSWQQEMPGGEREDKPEERTAYREEKLLKADLTADTLFSSPLPALVWVGGIGILTIVQCGKSIRWKKYINRRKRSEEEGVCVVAGIPGPFTMGFFRPVIYLPEGLTPVQRQYILLHEQTHIRRRDYLLKPAAFCITCMHWFNPFAWLSYRLMCMDMEMSCDEAVLSGLRGIKKKEYAHTLMFFAGAGSGDGSLAFGEPYAKKRIRNVLSYRRPAYRISLVLTVVCLAASGCLMTRPAEMRPEETDAESIRETKEKEARQTAGENYQSSWMTEEERLDYFTAFVNAPEKNVFLASGETARIDSVSYMETEKLDGGFIRYIAFALKENITAEELSQEESSALLEQGLDISEDLVRVSRETIRRAWEEGTGRPFEESWFEEFLSGWYEWNGVYYQVATEETIDRLNLVCTQASQEEEGQIRLIYHTAGLEEEAYWIGEAVLSETENGWYFVSNQKQVIADEAGQENGKKEMEAIEAYYASFAEGSTDPMITEDSLVWEADLTHDGRKERIVFDWKYFNMASTGVMAVLDEQGKVLYADEAGAAHTGWKTWYLCRWEGQDYLFEYSPNSGTGYHSYSYELFSFDEEGAKIVWDSGSIGWPDLYEPDFVMDISAMVEFAETVNSYIKESYLLICTDSDMLGESLGGSGRELFRAGSPQEPHRMPETYQVLENNEPDIPDLSGITDLAEKIRTWCEAVGREYTPASIPH